MHNTVRLVFIVAPLLCAEERVSEPRQIPPELYAEVYRAQGQLLQAKISLDAAVAAIVEFCGPAARPNIDLGDPKKNACLSQKPRE